jgi:hypothetical protein
MKWKNPMKMNFKSITAILCVLTVPLLSQAKEYASKENCGSAQIVEGTSCPNIKVNFTFSNCELKSEPKPATKVLCEDKTLLATFEAENFKYEAQFESSTDSWGALSWKSLGPLKQWTVRESAKETTQASLKLPEKKKKKITVAPTPTPAPTPAFPDTPVAKEAKVEAKSEATLKFSGFFDFRMTSLSRDPLSGSSGSPESGFGVEDGALFLNYQKESLSFLLDVPFRRLKNSDVGVTTNPNASPNGNVVWGNDKLQAFVKYASPSNFEAVFGQFDTIFGVEVNDSKDRYFSKTGLVYDYMLPVTHTGALVSYNYNGAYGRLLSANSNNKGSLGASASGDNNYEYGAALGFANDMFRGQWGYLARPINKASGENGGLRSLTDVTLGTTLGKFNLDLEYSNLKDESKNTLTPADTSDIEANGVGYFLLASYNVTDQWSLGARIEQVTNDPAQLSVQRTDSQGLETHYKWNSQLETRIEWIQYRYQQIPSLADTLTDKRFGISNIFTF